MIQCLRIRNIAIIDQLTIDFHPGLQVITGETGAGKSILMDAVNLILGSRADKTLIRSGAESAMVEAGFDTAGDPLVRSLLEREQIDFDGQNVTVFREISTAGKNICRVNGVLLPLSFLKELAPCLINLHGQSEHQMLADAKTHLSFLDTLGDREHRQKAEAVAGACEAFLGNHRVYAKLVKQNDGKEEKISQLSGKLEELKKARIKAGEEESLLAFRKRMKDAEKLNDAFVQARALLSRGGEDGESAFSPLLTVSRVLGAIAGEEAEAGTLAGRCENCYYEAEDIAFRISQWIDKNGFDPGKLEKAEKRLELIQTLEGQYHTTEEGLLQLQEEMEEELRTLSGLDKQIERMRAEHKNLLAVYRNAAKALTASRKQIAADFEKNLLTELNDLGMKNTRFEVEFLDENPEKPKMPTPSGDDTIRFMISPNPGEPLKPLEKITSGGELSRIMLSLKVLQSGNAGSEAMIFDEIDTGVSGKVAQAIAEKMISISRHQQVICISHLPQITAAADYHYLVEKSSVEGRTVSGIREMDEAERILEVGRMISGAEGISEQAKDYAKEMIEAAKSLKKKY